MSPGQGLYLHAVAMATPTMTNTRVHLCQVGEAGRNRSLSFHHSEELLIPCFDLSSSASQVQLGGCSVTRGLCSQWGKDDARPTGTLDVQLHSRRSYLCPPKCLRVLWQLTSCMAMSTKTFTSALANDFFHGALLPLGHLFCSGQQMLEQIRGLSKPTCSEAECLQRHIHRQAPAS